MIVFFFRVLTVLLFVAAVMSSGSLTNLYAKTVCSSDDWATLKKSGFPETQMITMCDKPTYPVIGSREGYIDKIAETDLPKLATRSYPIWYRGTGPGSSYNDDSTYWGRWMVGPKKWVQSGLVADKIAVGTMLLKPKAKYPVHNHPTWELYVVLEGNGVFVKNDRRYDIIPNDFLITRPYDPHALKNISESKPLKLLWIWWQEGDVGFDIMNAGGQPINPVKCWKDKKSACMSPVPMPPPLTGKDADKYLYDPTIYTPQQHAKTVCSSDDRATLNKSGFPKTQIVAMCDKPTYPVIGSREGYIDKIAETDLPKLATRSYPTWYRGTGPGSSYNDDSTYWGRWMVGPKKWVQSGLVADKIAVGTMLLKPKAKYPVHNHPTWELYVVLEGNGVFVKNDRRYDVGPNDFLITRPYDPHALKNISESKPLKVLWIWWQEGDVGFDIMNAGGQPINPVKCWKDKESACMSPVPMPPPLTGKDADKYLYNPTIYTPQE